MGRIFGIVLLVAAIWLVANYATTGSLTPDPDASEARRSTPQRAGDAVREAFDAGNSRRDKLLPE